MYNLSLIRERCDLLLAAAKIEKNTKRIKKLEEVQDFLKKDDCFVGVDENISRFALLRLGYSFDEADKIYEFYNNIEILSGLLEYKNKNGDIVQVEAMLCPSIDDYYIFDSGLIFKYDNRKQNFYSLINSKWVYDADLQRKFYDSGYNYERINYIVKKNNSPRR